MTVSRTGLFVVSLVLIGLTVAGAVMGAGSEGSSYRFLSNFADTLDLVRSAYVEPREVDAVLEGAFQGLVATLDPESAYLGTPEEVQAALSPPRHGGWLGLDVSRRHGYAVVVSVEPASPAAEAEINPGDIIRAIDGRSTQRQSIIWTRARLSRPAGEQVELKLYSGSDYDTRDVSLLARPRPPARLEERELRDGVLYLRPSRFTRALGQQLARRLTQAGDTPGVVIDLRGVSQGELTEGLRSAAGLLADDPLGRLRGRSDEQAVRRALQGFELEVTDPDQRQGPEFDGYELVVLRSEDALTSEASYAGQLMLLTDGSTAGAAELFAAALMDAGRAHTVGRRSFGRASIQDILPTGEGTALRLTVAQFVRANGVALAPDGLTPDYEVEDVEADAEEDRVLDTALEILLPHAVEAQDEAA